MQKANYPDDVGSAVIFNSGTAQYLPQCYESIVKNKMSNFFPSVPFLFREVIIGSTLVVNIPSSELENYCRINKCIGVQFITVPECYIYNSGKGADIDKYIYPESGSSRIRRIYSWLIGDADLEIKPTVSLYDDATNFVIIMAMPIVKQVDGRNVVKLTGATARMIGILFS